MFRKLVSNLPYSPSVIADIGFYANRLRQEEITRRLTIIFVALALAMQSLAVFSPPQSVNASSEQDIIRGGVSDMNDFLARYDQNEDDLADIFNTLGISRSELASVTRTPIKVKPDLYIMSRFGQVASSDKEVNLTYNRSAGGVGTRYFSPATSVSSSPYKLKGWTGTSANLGWFGIVQSSGSLVTNGVPAALSTEKPASSSVVRVLSAMNVTRNGPAEKFTAKPNDSISYSLRVQNVSAVTASTDYSIRINDILEYSNLIDAGGADYDASTGTLSWPEIQLPPGTTQEKVFAVTVKSVIPSSAQGLSNPGSFDCKISATFGTTHESKISCPAVKAMESTVNQLPSIGTAGNVIFISTLLLVVGFFLIRTHQLKKEIRLIRHNFNTGVI